MKMKVRQAKALFMFAAGLSLTLSVVLFFLSGEKLNGIFVGLWVPSILALGGLITQGLDE
jgi:hypothetical protein